MGPHLAVGLASVADRAVRCDGAAEQVRLHGRLGLAVEKPLRTLVMALPVRLSVVSLIDSPHAPSSATSLKHSFYAGMQIFPKVSLAQFKLTLVIL